MLIKQMLPVFLILYFMILPTQENKGELHSPNHDVPQTNTETAEEARNTVSQEEYLNACQILSGLNLENSLEDMGLSNEEVDRYARDVLGDFLPKAYTDNMFPSGLISIFEKVLYDYRYENQQWGLTEAYDKALHSLGSEKFQVTLADVYALFPELISEKGQIKTLEDAYQFIHDPEIGGTVYHIFSVPLNTEGRYFLIKYQPGGSSGYSFTQLVKLQNGKRQAVGGFEQQNIDGQMVQYGNGFYYVSIEYNYELKISDGIRIHKIEPKENMSSILIKLLPVKYSWKTVFVGQTKFSKDINQYIESMKSDITSKYINNDGTERTSLLYGDEAEQTAAISAQGVSKEYYIIDFANLDVPVYLNKYIFFPSNSLSMHLMAKFLINDTQTNTIMKLDNLTQDDRPPDLNLIQIWFKKIGDKVFTFRIYHVSSYNYLLNRQLLNC